MKHEQTIDGSCNYIKLFGCKLNQANMHGESPYNVVFGPSTKKVLGDAGNKCAEDYPYYGQSLLELSRLEAGVLEPTLEGSNTDTVIKAKGDRRSPSLLPEGKSQALEGGARFQVTPLPNNCTKLSQTNPCLACTPTKPSKVANLILTSAMNLLIIKTWGNPRGDLVEPGVPVLPLMYKFWIKSKLGTFN